MDFWQIYRIILRKKWIVIAITLVATVSAAIGSSLMAKHYRAAAVLMPSDVALLHRTALGGGDDSPGARETRFSSLLALARSEGVANRAIRDLRLNVTANTLLHDVMVGPVVVGESSKPTEMIEIDAYNQDPRRAVQTANAMAHAFVNYYQEVTHQEASQNRRFLEEQYKASRDKLRITENALTTFKATRKLVSLPEEIGTTMSGLGALRNDRDNTQAQLMEVEARLSSYQIQLNKIEPVRTVHDDSFQDPLVHELETKMAQLESDEVMELAVHTPKHSRVKLLDSQIASIKTRLDEQLKKSKPRSRVITNPVYEMVRDQIFSLETERRAVSARLANLNSKLSERQSAINGLTGVDDKLAALVREQRLAEENYSAVVAQLNQARLNEKISNDSGGIAIVDLATTAEGPIHRGMNGSQMILAAFVLSLLAGIGLVVVMEALDNTIRTGKDAEDLVGLPVTGQIPRLTSGLGVQALPKITHVEPASAHAEAYRFLGTDFLFTAADEPIQTVMVATAQPGQGGTTTITNLAITIAQAGRRVVLVDADMRRPAMHRIFGVSNEIGLSSVLQGEASLAEALRPTGVENLLLLAGGPAPSNPWKLLRSRKMREVISTLKEQSDFVFFDSPSAVVFADAAVLASMVDGVVLVVRAQQSPRGSELQVRNLLNKAKANIIGVVLNDASPDLVDSYRYHTRYYELDEVASSSGNGRDSKSLMESTSD